MDKKLNFKFDHKALSEKMVRFITHKSSLIMFGIGIIFLGYVIVVWYQDVYSYQWDDVKKQEYMNEKNAGTNLNRVKFEKALADIAKRKENYEKTPDESKDIFRLGAAQSSAHDAAAGRTTMLGGAQSPSN